MKNVTDYILILLRGIAKGDTEILTDDRNEDYVAVQCANFNEYKDWHKADIIERLQYELYGEFPLSYVNQVDWDMNVEPAFKLNDIYRRKVGNGQSI